MTTYRKFDAKVTKNDDPEKRGRICVTCPALMGDDEEEVAQWVEPVPAWGWFIVPDIGELVELEGIVGNPEDEQFGQSSIDSLDLKWRSSKRYWGNSEAETGATPIPEDFTSRNYGKRRGFVTPAGHTFLFDDTSGDAMLTLTWHQEGKRTFYTVDKNGSIIMNTHAGHLLYMNAKTKELSLTDPNGNHYRSKDATLSLMNKDGCTVEMKGANVQVLAMGACTVAAKDVSLKAGTVNLGDLAAHAAILGDLFMTYFMAHTHPTAFGPSGPPIPTGAEASVLSTTVKTQA